MTPPSPEHLDGRQRDTLRRMLTGAGYKPV
jgi:hypothetical protein